MKPFGCILEYTEARNSDLLRAFDAACRARGALMPDIFRQVADSPASRFWVSEDRAAVVISAMVNNRPLPRMRHNKKEMYGVIYGRYLILQQRYPDRSLPDLVAEVVQQPAPKFYLTPRTVGEMIYRIKNGWYERGYRSGRDDIKRE